MKRTINRLGFTLIELLVVIAIIALLAAIIFPVFAKAKKAAKKTQDLSNLHQVGTAMDLYMGDYDDLYPNAVDAVDKYRPQIWASQPDFMALIPSMPLMNEALMPYVKNKFVFKCPLDDGTAVLDTHPYIEFKTAPSMFAVYGLSYVWRTEITFHRLSQTSLADPAHVNTLFTAAGNWLGDGARLELTDDSFTIFDKWRGYRYNILYGDFHAKNVNHADYDKAWSTPLQ